MDNSQILDTNNNICSNKKSIKNYCVKKLSVENVIINSSDIVFNNQTDKFIKSDVNNKQLNPVMGKYNLRKKSIKTRSDNLKSKHQELKNLRASIEEDKKPKKRNPQLSKYKRKNANARERSRVQVNFYDNFSISCIIANSNLIFKINLDFD